MRWPFGPFGPPHLTLKPSKKKTRKTQKTKQKKNKTKKTQKTKKNQNKERKSKKHKNTKKRAFQLSVKMFFIFGGGVQKLPFLTTWPRKRAPPNTIKIGVSANFFLKKVMRHETAIFGQKKPKSRNSSYHFFCLFLFQQQKTPKLAETPIFIVF